MIDFVTSYSQSQGVTIVTYNYKTTKSVQTDKGNFYAFEWEAVNANQ